MAGRNRSDSESSSSSSSSGSSVEARTTQVSTSKLPASRNLSNIAYRPPRGFEPVSFSSSSPFLHSKLAAADKQQQLWTVRIPAGLSPAELDGLVIDLPRDSKDASKPLASIQVATASPAAVDTYNLYASASAAAKGKAKSTASSADSQLIVMASDKAVDQAVEAGAAVGQGAATELESLRLLVPAGDGGEDEKMVVAPVKVTRCLHLSIASPAETTQAQKPMQSANTFEQDKLPQQPWHLLKGNFKPAGSRGPTQTSAGVEEDKRDKKRKVKSEAGADTDGKKSKKSKK
ncbi:hypothetical protein PANT_9c00153 [Moesziomyces antarcticus T-34]|uniref:Uncharacterized protein n=1 Tax=Pseudozyma antarctica (strain T-34) TaxID=1151754 RepID=M9LV51_PSEA3|nr:hypothetical protein PANT_9c00153 [Moesziomyces antarcticus T-34]